MSPSSGTIDGLEESLRIWGESKVESAGILYSYDRQEQWQIKRNNVHWWGRQKNIERSDSVVLEIDKSITFSPFHTRIYREETQERKL